MWFYGRRKRGWSRDDSSCTESTCRTPRPREAFTAWSPPLRNVSAGVEVRGAGAPASAPRGAPDIPVPLHDVAAAGMEAEGMRYASAPDEVRIPPSPPGPAGGDARRGVGRPCLRSAPAVWAWRGPGAPAACPSFCAVWSSAVGDSVRGRGGRPAAGALPCLCMTAESVRAGSPAVCAVGDGTGGCVAVAGCGAMGVGVVGCAGE